MSSDSTIYAGFYYGFRDVMSVSMERKSMKYIDVSYIQYNYDTSVKMIHSIYDRDDNDARMNIWMILCAVGVVIVYGCVMYRCVCRGVKKRKMSGNMSVTIR